MLVPYVGTQWDCPSSRYNGQLYVNRRNNRTASTRRNKPQGVDKLFSPTACGVHNQSSYNDSLATMGFQTTCNGVKVTRYATKSGYNYGGGVSDPTPSTSYCPAVRMNQLLAKIKSEKVNLGLMSAEYRKTASAFVQAVNRMVEIHRAIKRLKLNPLRKPPNPGRRVTNNVAHQLPKGSQQSRDYLLVRYGLLPTVQDMVGALEVLSEGATRPLISRKTKNASSTYTTTNGINQTYYPGHYRYFDYENTSKLIAYVQWNPQDISNQINQLGLSNPLALAWELIPYSFVVDWLIPVGETLGSLDALNGSSRHSCTTTKRATVKMRTSFPGSYRGRAYSRAVTVLTPSLPGYKKSTSAIHIADALALLTKHKL